MILILLFDLLGSYHTEYSRDRVLSATGFLKMTALRRFTSLGFINIFLIAIFFMLYSLITFYIAGLQQNCLSAREIAAQIRVMQLQENDDQQELKAPKQQQDQPLPAINTSRSESSKETRSHIITAPPGNVVFVDGFRETSSQKPNRTVEIPRKFFVNDELPQTVLLNSSYAPNTVYYVWCGKRWFEFPHYLSVMSVIRHLRPDNLVFFYDVEPVIDSWTYNTWFGEIADKYPFFRRHQLTEPQHACDGFAKPRPEFIYDLLTRGGGMYINELTILTKFPVELRNKDVVNALNTTTGIGFLMTKRGLPGVQTMSTILQNTQLKTLTLQCIHRDQYVQSHRKSYCVYLTTSLFPKDIWELDNSFGRLVRTIFYGTPKILRLEPTYDELIPNIAHIVWLGGGPMDFLFYLCVLSLINMAKVDAVYIHGDGPPTGSYWELIKNHEKVHLIYRQQPGTIYGTNVNVLSHVTDIWRVDFMIKYGGIYVDTDTIFIRPLDREIRGYDAIGSYDWTYWNHPFPDTINFGVALGKRNAKFWHKFQESMKWFKDDDWAWNGLRQPYRIQERHPDLVRIDPHLQVICYLSLCHPTWWPDYHNESIHHLNSNSIKDWRTDAYAFHWTLPTPYELINHTTLLSSNSVFSEIATTVLEQSNMLDYFKRLHEGQQKGQ